MTDNIYNSELVSEPVINENDLFVKVENDLASSEKIDAPAYSYWRSVFRSFFRKPSNIIAKSFSTLTNKSFSLITGSETNSEL